MQRSISDNQPLASLFYVLLFVVYSSLSSIYPLFPPLFGVLFLLFSRALEKRDSILVLFLSVCLVIYEANFGYILFSSIIYFYVVQKFLMPKIKQNFSCSSCIKFSYVFLAYVGYFLFLTLLANIFLLHVPSVSYYIVYYIIIEFLIVSLL